MPDIEDIWDDEEDMRMHGGVPVSIEYDIDTYPDWEAAKIDLDEAIRKFVSDADILGVYMPSLATYLRFHGDELADKYPDDTNGGNALQ